MKRLKITNEQYNRIILHEQKSRILMEAEQKGLNYSNEVLLGIAKLMGLDIKGFNSTVADAAVKKDDVMKSIKDSLENSDKRQELIDDLIAKGLVKANMLYKADSIASNFNKFSKENKLGYTMDNFSLVKKILKDK
tara:strand:+ start:65 stop:472 length:408 start_codon:yes stop_codon:yes gene_type:complete